MPPRGKKKTKSAARKTKRTGTFACRCLTQDQRAQDGHLSEGQPQNDRRSGPPSELHAKASARTVPKRSASSRKAANGRRGGYRRNTAPVVAARSAAAWLADEPDEIIILSTDELMEETDIDLGGDEDGGDDDLEGM